MKEKIICVIPARYNSERFPGKVLFKINGKSVLQRVYERAKLCKKYFSEIIVATDDERVVEAVSYTHLTLPTIYSV